MISFFEFTKKKRIRSWDHPNDHFFRTLYKKTKEQENASIKMAEAASILFRSSGEREREREKEEKSKERCVSAFKSS